MRRGRGLSAALVMAFLACGGGADREGDPALSASIQLSPTPPMVGEAVVRVVAEDGGVPLAPGARVTVGLAGPEGDVPSPVALEAQAGAWTGTLPFPEAGESIVVVTLEAPDGRRAILRFPVRVSRAL